MRHKETKALHAYWVELMRETRARDLHAAPPLPRRDDVQPSAIRDLLGDVFLLDGEEGHARYRLAGSRLCALYGRELRDTPFVHAWSGRDRATTRSWSQTFGADVCVILISSLGTTQGGRSLPLETLLLPLDHGGRSDVRGLGITTPGGRSSWIGMDPVRSQDVRSVRIMRPWQDDAFRGDYPVVAPFPSARVDRRLQAGRQVGHLRVLDGGLA